MPLPTRAACLAATALVSGARLALPGTAAAQSRSATPPDNNRVTCVNPGQAGGDGTGRSLGDYEHNFSPPTALNGDTNDAGGFAEGSSARSGALKLAWRF